jgi:hypothetical protein
LHLVAPFLKIFSSDFASVWSKGFGGSQGPGAGNLQPGSFGSSRHSQLEWVCNGIQCAVCVSRTIKHAISLVKTMPKKTGGTELYYLHVT